MVRTVYIDTSIVGGVFDVEFQLWTELFFKEVYEGYFKLAISDILLKELAKAPAYVQDYLDSIPSENIIAIGLNQEAQ